MAFGGKQYGLPLSLETLCLVYNKDLVKEPPQTMDDLIRMAGSLTGRDRNGFLFEVFDFYFAFPFFSGYGGYIFKDTLAGPDEKDLGLANEGSVKAARLLLDLQKKYRLIPPGLRKDVINGRFLDGKVAMTIAGPWSLTDYKKKKMNYGVCRIPRLDNGRWSSPLVGVTGVMMSATSSRPKDAIALMKHISGKEAQVAIYKAGGRTPTRKDAINDPAVSGDRDVKAIQDQASVGTPMPNIPALTQVWTPMIEALQLISTEQQTPEEALRDAQARTLKNIELMMK
jgi:maltose-binding protein MalE